ncbi:hypothetical protein [Robertmurraya massiliosenegalensis]|nr:hypothetical protein [Robertmurraya massiliosenegalensis]
MDLVRIEGLFGQKAEAANGFSPNRESIRTKRAKAKWFKSE